MAQRNQPDNVLGGFANPEFVLINGDFWNCRQKRRYIQGQIWLNEFTFILLQCVLQICRRHNQDPQHWQLNKQTETYFPRPLIHFGPLEILKYIGKNANASYIFATNYSSRRKFLQHIYEVLHLRNLMTHEVGIWTTENIPDTYIPLYLQKLLKEMIEASRCLAEQNSCVDVELLSHVNGFIDKCESELGKVENQDHRDLLY